MTVPISRNSLRAASRHRRGMQLLELLVSLATASILMAGISAAVAISKQTLDSVSVQAKSAASAQGGIQLFANDLREAKQVDSRTSTSIALKVPDRNNDGVAESVRYRWSTTTGPLETSNDGVSWRALGPDLSNMQLNWRAREPQSTESITPLDTSGRVSYMGMASNVRTDSARSLTIAPPPGCVKGDACLAVLSVSSNPGNIKADDSWTKISQTSQDNYVSLGMWYTTSVPGNTTFTWGDNAQAIGCIVHLSGNHKSPHAASANASAYSQVPAPGIGGSHSQEFVVRALAGIGSGLLSDSPSVAGHSSILLRQVDLNNSSYNLTLAVACQSVPGSTIDPAHFQFSPSSVVSCAGTVALRP